MLDNNSASTIRKTIQHFFHQVFVRIGELANGIPEANERANVACKSLELLRWEKNIQNFVPQISGQTEIPQSQHVEQDWQTQVQTQIDRVLGLICNVNNRAEQAYLRRLLLEAVLQIDKYRQFTELVVDSLLAEIDDEEERQNAIYLCILSISSEIQNNNDLNSDKGKALRAKGLKLADELDDLHQFETAIAKLANATLFNISFCRSDSESLPNSSIDGISNICSEISQELALIKTPEGFIKFFDTEAALFGKITNSTIARIRHALFIETRHQLAILEKTIETGVNSKGNQLSETERQELNTFAHHIQILSPFILEHGDFIRHFIERFQAFDALSTIFKIIDEHSLPEEIRHRYEKSLAPESRRYLDLARKLACNEAFYTGIENKNVEKLRRISILAQFEFLYGDKESAKNDVRTTLALLSDNGNSGESVSILADLIKTHLQAKLPKAARKLATLLEKAINRFTPGVSRDFALSSHLTLFRQLYEQTEFERLVDSLESPGERFHQRIKFQLIEILGQQDETMKSRLENHFNHLLANAEKTFNEPDEIAFALIRAAETVYHQYIGTQQH